MQSTLKYLDELIKEIESILDALPSEENLTENVEPRITGTENTSRDGVLLNLSNTFPNNERTSERYMITPIMARSRASRHPIIINSPSQEDANTFSVVSFKHVRMMSRTISSRLNINQDISTRFIISF